MSRLRSLIREGEVVWNPEFTRRRSLNFKDLGKTYVEWKAECMAEIEEDLATAQAALLPANIVPLFMRDDEDRKISAEADKVEAFCPNVTLQSLITEAWEGCPSLEPVALLDERSLDGSMVSTIHNQGPLTARQLFKALKEPRFRPSNMHPPNGTEEGSNAWRRRIFITDLDCWSICAIVGTALRYQRTAIRSVLYRHLQFKPCIHVNIPPEGKQFQFAFHLPYTPMRDSDVPSYDTRRFRDGRPLRRHQNVSFLDLRGSHIATHRYESQLSFVMIGTDDLTWDTYYFEDTYFDPVQDQKRLVQIYDEDSRFADGTRVAIDPSTRGIPEFEPPILDPRQYFLTVLRYSLEHVTEEWKRNVDRVNDSIRDYHQSQDDLQSLSISRLSGRKVRGLSTIEWLTKLKEFSNTVFIQLSSEVDIIETFFLNHKSLFQTDLCIPMVSKITDILVDLEYLRKTLESDVNHCQNLIENQQSCLNEESTEVERKHHFISRFVYPVAIGVGVFSMEAHVLPFKADTVTFLWVVLIAGVLISFGYDPLWYWQVSLTVAGKVGSKEYFQAMYLGFRRFWRPKPTELAISWRDPESLLGLAGGLSRFSSPFSY